MSEEAKRRFLISKYSVNVPQIFQLNPVKTHDQAVRKLEVGKPSGIKNEKIIILLGAAGAGKTTLINGMVNNIFGVEWKDDFRVRLIPEEKEGSNQDKVQSLKITAYTIHHQPNFKVKYSLTIIDVPEFDDSSVGEKEMEIAKQLEAAFNTKGKAGLDQISAIGFVVQSSVTRLSDSQRYIFDTISSLFGQEGANKIVPLVTSADSERPRVLDTLKDAKINFSKHFKFNNSALFLSNSNLEEDDDEDDDNDEDEDEADGGNDGDKFNEVFWNMGAKMLKTFFGAVKKMPNNSLAIVKRPEAESLEEQMEEINIGNDSAMMKLHQLDQEIEILQKHGADIDDDKDFTYTVEEKKTTVIEVPEGKFNTYCLTCKTTCHPACVFKNDEDKLRCTAMENGICKVCPGRCVWTEHKNLSHIYQIDIVKVNKTADDLKKRYQTMGGEKMTKAKVVSGIAGDLEDTYKEVVWRSLEAKQCITRMREIASKPNPLSTTQYVDLMIQGEKTGQNPGFQKRIEQLKEVKKAAIILDELIREGFDPFKDHSDTIVKVKQRYNATRQGDTSKCRVM